MKDKSKPRPATGPTPEFIEWFLAEWGCTAETLEDVLGRVPPELGKAPTVRTIHRWLLKDVEFGKAYKDSKLFKGERCLDEAQRIADTANPGKITVKGVRGGKEESSTKIIDNVERSKLQVQVLMKRAGALNPALRESMTVKSDPEQPLTVKVDL